MNYDSYTPNAASREILECAWGHIQSVPYRTTARWLFYRLLQDGIYKGKADYKDRFLPLFSRARKAFWGPWRPDTLADDTRNTYPHGGGERDAAEWAAAVSHGLVCGLDHWYRQSSYVEFWFEAAAMRAQFEHYTRGVPVTLRPFQGQPSIDYKWQAAKELEEAAARYGAPVTVCYFGDYDDAGLAIEDAALSDVRAWCAEDVATDRIGLNEGDGQRYGIPEDFEKPGVFQWEALPDDAARVLIRGAIDRYIDLGVIRAVASEAATVEAAFGRYVSAFGERWASLQS